MLNALVGSSGMEPTINAIRSKVDVALSNKESLVMAGSIITNLADKTNVKFILLTVNIPLFGNALLVRTLKKLIKLF